MTGSSPLGADAERVAAADRGNAASDEGSVTLEVRGDVAYVRFGHPKSNSLPGSLLERLATTVRDAGSRDDVRVIVLSSEGTGAFCAGASFDEFARIADAEQGTQFFSGFARVILAMRGAPKFVIVRVQGRTVGGGVGLVAAADYAIASHSAEVKLSELAVGIGPFVVGPAVERKIGVAAFQALSIDATTWRDAEWARQVGLFSQVEDSLEALDGAVESLAQRLAASNPDAMARMKAVFWEGTEHWTTLLSDRATMSGTLVLGEHTKRAIAGILKR